MEAMEYKRFASHGSDNPMSDVSMKRRFRGYPLKRNTFGVKKNVKEKKAEMVAKMK